MVSITKKTVAKSLTADARRATRRLREQMRNALLSEEKAMRRRGRLEVPQTKQKYGADIRLVNKLGAGFRGEISYKLLGNKRLRVDNARELTREHGLIRKTRKVLKRDAETDGFYLSLHERKTWASVSRHQYAEDGTLLKKHIKHRDRRFEEKWERDENGTLIRTRYVDRGRLNGKLFQPVSEEMSAPYRGGPENRLYRKLTRQVGSNLKTFERDDKGNLELVSRKRLGFSKNSTKAEDRNTSYTKIRKLGGTFSKSYRSLLDKEGNELGRDILSHRRLFNKRSAIYDNATGQLKGTKHTFGKIYKSEASYIGDDLIKVSKKILGVAIQRRLRRLGQQEHDAQTLRASEATHHKLAWQEREAAPSSSHQGTANIHAVPQLHLSGLRQNDFDSQPKAEVTAAKGGPVDVNEQISQSNRRLDPRFKSQPSSSSPDVRFASPDHQARVPNSDDRRAEPILPHHNRTGVQTGKNLREPVKHLFSPTHPGSNVSVLPQAERIGGQVSLEASSRVLTGARKPANKVDALGQSESSAPNNHAPDPEQHELLNFLHSVPIPPLPEHNGGGRPDNNPDCVIGNISVSKRSVSESVVEEHPQGHLSSGRSTVPSIDPQSLFGEPDVSRLLESRPESPLRGNNLSDPEQQALLNELLGMPLPVSPQKLEPQEHDTLENSRSRERSASRGFSL
ncbi:virA/G regulated protein [Agrobacterium vitis]|uniref:virA/G regulated protein n=1 Tax=Agrobacterium vitis TaxID=373 RepID=UPI0012E94908|nr:virA/G regulated protein [Agrobacterium vitis]MVA64232.1 virA/G regulated protein [Agrobacterium vitis]